MTSRPRSSSTARAAQRASLAATEARARAGLRRSHRGRLDHSLDSAPMRRSLATVPGGARSAPAAPLGTGRSPPAGPQRQTRLEAQALGRAAIQCGSVQNFLPTSCGNCGKPCGTAGAWAAAASRRLYDAWPGCGNGDVRRILGKSANFCRGSAFARSSGWRDAGRMGRRASRKLTARPWGSGCARERIEAGPGGSLFPPHIRAAWGGGRPRNHPACRCGAAF
jgi:hypothetical protein